MRLDRFLTLHVFGPLARLGGSKALRIPILMYHSISDEPESGHPYYWINTSPARFAEHMKFLHDNSYQVISLSKAVDLIREQGSISVTTDSSFHPSTLPPFHHSRSYRYVVLTFDDGYLDFYTRAFHALQSYGYTATVFLPTAYIDGKRPGLRGKEHLNWEQVRELHTAGIDFGSHTVNHPQLHDLKPEEIDYELRESKKIIESRLDQTATQTFPPNPQPAARNPQQALPCSYPGTRSSVDSFSYPYKFPEQDRAFVSELCVLLERAGHRCGVSTRLGGANASDGLFFLRRLPVNSADDVQMFSAKLAGHYDWVSLPQSFWKGLRNRSKGTSSESTDQPMNVSTSSSDQSKYHPVSLNSHLAAPNPQPDFLNLQPVTHSFRRYVIITPVRDEEKYIRYTLDSVVNQTTKPVEWVIVNDGSTDTTGEIVDRYAAVHPWIKAIHRQNRGYRKAGGGVIDAFYDGYRSLSLDTWDFVVKLDGDLSFEPDYFEKCFEHFRTDPKLGLGGGDVYNLIEGRLELEKQPRFHVRGATKIYKRSCWDAMGRLLAAPGWDTLDEVKANMLGWTTYSFPDLRVTHYRYTGAADGTWRSAVKNGLADYICGYHPLFMASKCIKRLVDKPYLLASLGHLYGFAKGYLKGVPQVDDPRLIRYLRGQQLNRLFLRRSIWA